jgi:hypothetical protein
MNIILETPYARIAISETGDILPDDLPDGTVTIMPIGNRDAFFTREELIDALNLEEGDPAPKDKGDTEPKFLEPSTVTQDGFIVLSNVNGTSTPGFRDVTTGQVRVHANESTAQLEVIEAIEEELREYRAGERAFNELNCADQDWVEPATLHPDGVVTTEEDEFHPVVP